MVVFDTQVGRVWVTLQVIKGDREPAMADSDCQGLLLPLWEA